MLLCNDFINRQRHARILNHGGGQRACCSCTHIQKNLSCWREMKHGICWNSGNSPGYLWQRPGVYCIGCREQGWAWITFGRTWNIPLAQGSQASSLLGCLMIHGRVEASTKMGPSGGTKNETAKSQIQQQRPTRATNKKWQLRLVKQQAYRVGTEEAHTCEAWFHLTFRPQKWNLKAHMWYQLSPFPSSNAAIAMQHHPGNIHQSVATPRYSATPWYVLIQVPNVIDTMSKRWRSKQALILHLLTSFPKQILTPSRFKLIRKIF